ncbi:MAG TPA: hypothetical protein GX723_03265 [Thermoanaerobacterales bacterium]|jgi:hypothetical protein|nr:hypothetical protein [Thermoanaerobacterales bacterium]
MPTVNVGTPRDTREYDSYEIDGIKVYVSPSVNIEDGLRVVTSGFMFLKGLAVVPIKS